MPQTHKGSWLFAIWAVCAVSLGSALMSFHQPFRAPAQSPDAKRQLLALVPTTHRWRALHILSASCGCSQRVMQHLLTRSLADASEEILIIDSADTPLPQTPALLAALQQRGIPVAHLPQDVIPSALGLHAVPLLVLVSPEDKIAYTGGYGPQANADVQLLAEARAGQSLHSLPILGCALTSALARQTDPFHLKP